MPIKRLTDGQARWPRLGVLRKGSPKPANGKGPGRDLKQVFRFDGADDDIDRDWSDQFGDLKVDELLVRLPYPDVDACWQSWMEEWVAGGLVHRCDGEACVLWRDDKGEYQTTPRSCPGGCKEVGRLELFVPDFRRMGVVTLLTTSINDIISIDGCLRSLQIAFGDLSRVPLVLRRVPREISTPGTNGKRARREAWLISLEAAPEWVRYMLDSQGQAPAALTADDVRALPAPNGELVDEETGEIVDAGEIVDVPPPMDDTVPEAVEPPESWRERIEALKTRDELRSLYVTVTDESNFDNEYHQRATLNLYFEQAVKIVVRSIGEDVTPLDVAEGRKILGAIPDNTEGKSAAMDLLDDADARVAA